jgi:hypothetical protein
MTICEKPRLVRRRPQSGGVTVRAAIEANHPAGDDRQDD